MTSRATQIGEWLAWSAVLVALVMLATAGQWLAALDRLAFDLAMTSWQRPASPQIVVVAIDDASLARLGRWPWPRTLHAELLERLARARPAAVLVDLILAEPDADPRADAALADALQRLPQVALPLYVDVPAGQDAVAVLPQPAFAHAAGALGHIHLELDADGVGRRVFLEEGLAGHRWPHLALATLRLARGPAVAAGFGAPAPPLPGQPGSIGRDRRYIIPFSGPPHHHETLSYAALLRGEIPIERLAGRIVLIGAVAAGLGDAYPTPLSGQGVAMPGVEIMAHLIQGLDEGIDIREAGPLLQLTLAPALVLLLLLSFIRLSPRGSLLAVLLALPASAAGVGLALRWGQLWLPPAPLLLGLLLAYPLWSWRRLEAAQRYLQAELRHSNDELALAAVFTPTRPAGSRAGRADFFMRRIDRAGEAAEALRRSRRVLAQSLAGLPVAVLVCDPQQRVFLSNEAAGAALGEALDTPLAALLGRRQAPPAGDWSGALSQTLGHGASTRQPLHGDDGRVWLVSIAPYAQVDGAVLGAIVTLNDVTELQRLRREEREVLQFISHDLRTPQNAILSLVELAAAAPPPAQAELLARIERQSRQTLALIDALALRLRADRLDPAEFRDVELVQLLHEAADQLWPTVKARHQPLALVGAEGVAWVRGSAELLQRTITNLAQNASKYSRDGDRLTLALRRDGSNWVVEVHDTGVGIAAEHLPRLFDRYYRVPDTEARPGSGLGLAFASTVARRHGGTLGVTSQPGLGSCFMLSLPAAADAADEADPAADPIAASPSDEPTPP